MKNTSPLLSVEALKRGILYSWNHPHLLLMALTQSFRQRLLIPLDSLRWLVKNFVKETAPIKKIQLKAHRPGLRLGADVEIMGEVLHVEITVRVSKVKLEPKKCLLTIEMKDVTVDTPPQSAMAPMLDMVDLHKPGLLLEWLPSLPDYVVETGESHVTLDMAKIPFLQHSAWFQTALAALSQVISIEEVRVGHQAILVQWKFYKEGIFSAARILFPAANRSKR